MFGDLKSALGMARMWAARTDMAWEKEASDVGGGVYVRKLLRKSDGAVVLTLASTYKGYSAPDFSVTWQTRTNEVDNDALLLLSIGMAELFSGEREP